MTPLTSRAPAHVRAISPYQPGKPISELAREMGLEEQAIVKLASNENPLGMSPRARAAVLAALGELARYPDGNGFALKAAISTRLGVGMDQIVLGNGSNDVLNLAARAFLAAGDSAVYSQYAFAVYPLAVQAAGATHLTVPAKDFGHDLPAMGAAVRADTKIVFIANPNNPTGTLAPAEQVLALLEAVPADVVVVLDEAYNEYLEPALRSASEAWLPRFPNLVITRTFSKIFGLAGLRVGYALASPAVADLLNRVREPFNVNSLALEAARAALQDDQFIAESYALNRDGMVQIVGGLKRLGLGHIPSHGNFVTFHAGKAAAANQRLLEQGVIVRPIGGYGMPEHLRVSIGTAAENERFLGALKTALAHA